MGPLCCMQGCSNILWGLAKQDLKAQEMYGMKGQPYLSMIEVLTPLHCLIKKITVYSS